MPRANSPDLVASMTIDCRNCQRAVRASRGILWHVFFQDYVWMALVGWNLAQPYIPPFTAPMVRTGEVLLLGAGSFSIPPCCRPRYLLIERVGYHQR